MPEVILPCPACGSTDCECLVCTINADESQTIHFHMACNKCFTSGPIADDAESAKKLWDSLPRALRWTTEPPKVAGWYWWRSGPGQNATTIRVHEYIKAVFLGEPCDPEEKVIGYWDQNGTFRTYLDRGEWAGPIAPPVE